MKFFTLFFLLVGLANAKVCEEYQKALEHCSRSILPGTSNESSLQERKAAATRLSFFCGDYYQHAHLSMACSTPNLENCPEVLQVNVEKCQKKMATDLEIYFKGGELSEKAQDFLKKQSLRKCTESGNLSEMAKKCVEEKKQAKLRHGEEQKSGKCWLKQVVAQGEPWQVHNGFDVFLDKKFIGHLHGKYTGEYQGKMYWEHKPQFKSCKWDIELSPEEKERQKELSDCQWVEQVKWTAQLGCKTQGEKICIGKIACQDKVRNIACKAIDGQCPGAKECALDESFTDEDVIKATNSSKAQEQ